MPSGPWPFTNVGLIPKIQRVGKKPWPQRRAIQICDQGEMEASRIKEQLCAEHCGHHRSPPA